MPSVTPPDERASSDRSTAGPLKVLVVDDDPDYCAVLRQLLEHSGHVVAEARDGTKVIPLYERFRPDVVLLDILMPVKDGLETIQDLRRTDSRVRIIAMTGGGFVDGDVYLKSARLLGAQQILRKPFGASALAAALAELMRPKADSSA